MADGTYYVVTGVYWVFHFSLWLAYLLQLIIQRRAKAALRRNAGGPKSAGPKRRASLPSDIPEGNSNGSGSGGNSNEALVTGSPPQSVTTDRAYTIIGKTNLDSSKPNSGPSSVPPDRPQRFRSFDEPDASTGNSTDALVARPNSQDDAAENEEKTTSGDGAVVVDVPSNAKPKGPKRSLSYRKRLPAPPRVGTLQKYLHPMGLFTQTVQLVQGIDPYSVFGVYDYRAPQLLFNTVNAMIIVMAAFTAYDFLRLRYNTILADIPPWMKKVIIAVVVFYVSEMCFAVFIRMDIGMKTWVNVINTFSMMASELIIAVIFIANVIHLTRLIHALDQSFHRHRPPLNETPESKRLCCADPSGQAQTPRENNKEPIPLADRQLSDVSSIKDANGDKPSEFRTIRVENSVSASISSTNRGKGTTFGRVVTNMQRFAWAAGICTGLVVLSQIYLVSGKFGELGVTEKQNDPEDSGGFWRDSPMFALQWFILFLGYYFTRLPIHYLWVQFHVKTSSHQPSGKAPAAAHQRSAPLEPPAE